MDLDDLIVSVYCLIDDELQQWLSGETLRERGPTPTLSDAEVLTIEAVGEYLGFSQDKGLFDYFRRHYAHFFPALGRLHRTTFTRQAANLFKAKEHLWQRLLARTHHDRSFALVDSFPLAACLFARAPRCQRFRGEAAFGRDTLLRQTFYGFRMHVRVCWPGVITSFSLAPANVHELRVVPEIVEGTSGIVVGDRNYHSPHTAQELREGSLELVAPYASRSKDPNPRRSAFLSKLSYRIDTVFGQLTERYTIKRLWARDFWHLASRVLRKVLSHTLAFLLGEQAGHSPLQLARLLD